VATFSPGRFACAPLELIVSKHGQDPAKRKPARKNGCPMSRLPDSTKEQLGLDYVPSPTTVLIQASVTERPIRELAEGGGGLCQSDPF
jgi:hypothetical protein